MKMFNFKNICLILLIIIFIIAIVIISTNEFIKLSTKKQILTEDEISKIRADCILVLGAGVKENYPSNMLEDRLLESINLYNLEVSDRLLMSGDHGRSNYNEVGVMKDFAIDKGINSKNIFMDHAGFSTYESIYRAKKIFKVKKVVIVTQKYHLYRALYIANRLGLEAYGVASDPRTYVNQEYREMREKIARTKDFFNTIIKPKPKYLGKEIPITGNGDVTNDNN